MSSVAPCERTVIYGELRRDFQRGLVYLNVWPSQSLAYAASLPLVLTIRVRLSRLKMLRRYLLLCSDACEAWLPSPLNPVTRVLYTVGSRLWQLRAGAGHTGVGYYA